MNQQDIVTLWKDENFPASFSGVLAMKRAIKRLKGIDVSSAEIETALKKEPNYIMQLVSKKRHKRRTFDKVNGYAQVWQADLGQLFQITDEKGQTWNYFLAVVDIASTKLFTRALQTKSASEVKAAFSYIFDKEAKIVPTQLETDQ
jgi:hypothetical protein